MPVTAATRVSAPSTASTPPTVRLGARSPVVAQLQSGLKKAGFDPGPADGVFGNKTDAALRAFQRSRGLTADGVAGPKTWGALISGPQRAPSPAPAQGGSGPTLREGARGTAVTKLQERLKAIGFSSITVDGSFGPKTAAAVKTFQRQKGLTPDGVVGPKTWAALGVRISADVPVTGGGSNPFLADFVKAAKTAGVPESWATSPALISLVRGESGWKPSAKNPTSTAFGLFQFLSSTWKTHIKEVPYGSTSPYWQAVGGYRYIKARYQTPERAEAFRQATVTKNVSLAPADLRGAAQTWINKGYSGY